jgi:peptide/nickel transport system substrate-binding protein
MRLIPALLAMCLLLLPQAAVHAQAAPKLLRIATAFDPQTMDPHSLALLYHTRISTQIYEGLVGRDAQYKLEPGLALEWSNPTPTRWRFKLRPGVVFHDGSAFTADDVVFSLERIMAAPSQRAFQLKGVVGARRVDALTVEIDLASPDAVLPEKLQGLGMMSQAWAKRLGAERAQDFNAKQETQASRQTNGTGPYQLVRYEPDARTVLKRNPAWWGWKDARSGNLEEVHWITIKADATRLAALASGEVDMVMDPPYQDIERLKKDARVSVLQVADIGQQYLTFDQARDELTHGDMKDRNPFKDKRVRQAVYQAINMELVVAKVLRGAAVPTGALLSTRVDGSLPELDKRLPYDPARAKALLAEAGYPNGFGVTLDCVNVAWREQVCVAVSGMLSQVGIRTQVRSSATGQFFPKLSQGTASFIEYGWTATPDAWASLNGLFRTFDKSGLGTFNAGRYSNPQLDVLIDNIRTEPDLTRRRAMVGVALRLAQEDIAYVPLYRRTLSWAVAKRFSLTQWPNDVAELRWVKVR